MFPVSGTAGTNSKEKKIGWTHLGSCPEEKPKCGIIIRMSHMFILTAQTVDKLLVDDKNHVFYCLVDHMKPKQRS